MSYISLVVKWIKKMKIKWVELTEDDPIFNRGFIISSPKLKIPKQEEKNEKIDKNLLRYLTVKVKKLDLDTDYFKKNEDQIKS